MQRYVIIGAGAQVFSAHRPGLQHPEIQIVAIAEPDEQRGHARAAELHCPLYTDYRTMLTEVQPDVAVVLTPHPLHAEISIACLRAGCHVLVEKPMAVHISEADAMIAAAAESKRLLWVVFQHRYRPEIQAIARLLQERRLGSITRVELTASWPRPASYYQQAPWRGTWAGEGGGVLMNQGIHHLDLLCYLLGLPERLTAWTRTRKHAIEVEDTAQALLEWSEGTLGFLHLSTAEADVAERLKLVGTRGRLELSRGQLMVETLEQDVDSYIATCQDPFGAPAAQPLHLDLPTGQGDHTAVYRAFQQAIRQQDLLNAGIQGRMSLELANAIIYSGRRQHEVTLPLDRAHYIELLESLRSKPS
ncbi:putative dehydrogenase [Thermosporothrix hazakensis]|uniref:Putative dehydrogenase n=1 Tax=Thermosporothrix hazakensis TaxID=644383 RepID=A0A326U5W0_THEHA|nr:Gfo/Idh/MocA family oxidoreductase [Thermosporothrix hazakensis]PZW27422.1 putative dehydrogenase [Thermosporothrix hazakensis]GCE45589.1 oxidoreductase [Thermosporothrix hazakensis]